MKNLKILASDEEGTLQRTIFEFSRRNISIGRLHFSRQSDSVTMDIGVEGEDAFRVLKHLNRIYGVREVRIEDGSE